MKITKEIFKSYLACPYKAYLLLRGETGNKSDYEILFREIEEKYRAEALRKIGATDVPFESMREFESNGNEGSIYQTNIDQNGICSSSCAFERIRDGAVLGAFHYVPVIFSSKERLTKENKMELVYDGFILEIMQARRPEFGKVVCGVGFKTIRFRLGGQIEKLRNTVSKIKKLDSNPPPMILNRHCHICEFSSKCRVKAIEKDDLSLLAGISKKAIETQNKKGILTVTQYSYTFRPQKKFKKSYPFNLKALALRENKIHLYGTFQMPLSAVQMYLDVEGDPERDFHYLIGVVIVKEGAEQKHAFWADNEEQEQFIFHKLVGCIKDYEEFKIYHYGSYETKFLRKIRRAMADENDICVVDKMLENAVNVLAIVYSHVFFPVYSNGLKDTGAYLGFKWTSKNASGITSLVWRKQFELTKDDAVKDRLIEYNLEDCLALKRVVEFVHHLRDVNGSEAGHSDIICADDLKKESRNKWGNADFVLKDLEYVNKCAYFDYQREKVFLQTNKIIKRINKRKKIKRSHRISKTIDVPIPRKCFHCKGRTYRHNAGYRKTTFDLKFTNAGVRKWLTISRTYQMRCSRCKKVIVAKDYKNASRYGHGLISFVVYQNIALHLPFERIRKILFDLFGFSKACIGLGTFKNIAVEYYKETHQRVLQRIISGDLIHIDETQIDVDGVSGYVWILTNMEDVYFLFRNTREGDFLRELLNGFKGVLISDFYGAYCFDGWIQQKCLVHLIRDLNDDMRKAPFDEEYKNMATEFAVLLRKIIATIDRFGLKKRHLGKHKKETRRFFYNLSNQDYHSELARTYQKRFLKNEHTLFTFLDYDGIPWNNNNAEHALKHFAVYRQTMELIGFSTERGFKEYLVLLSIYQTCRYRSISFLEFLISKEKDVDQFRPRKFTG